MPSATLQSQEAFLRRQQAERADAVLDVEQQHRAAEEATQAAEASRANIVELDNSIAELQRQINQARALVEPAPADTGTIAWKLPYFPNADATTEAALAEVDKAMREHLKAFNDRIKAIHAEHLEKTKVEPKEEEPVETMEVDNDPKKKVEIDPSDFTSSMM